MKILTIDDQQLILMSIEKRFKELGYDVIAADSGKKGIQLFDESNPDLVIVDMNMGDISGQQVIEYIRIDKKSNVPVMVLSGNDDEKTVLESFNLGINDYLKKPMSLAEVSARVKQVLKLKEHPSDHVSEYSTLVNKNVVGVVVPCYNESERLAKLKFSNFAQENPGYHICFVNDGSKDNTLEVLRKIESENGGFISVVDCPVNGGKAEAVRIGSLHLAKDPQMDYIGFLDADLSTDFADFADLVNTLDSSVYKIVSGSRISRMGANIEKESSREIISKTINLIIQTILGMPFKDTQCGAKVMTKDIAVMVFSSKFITRWLFDVEIFMRIKKAYGKKEAPKFICEQPLKRWVHMDGSKLSFRDSFKIVGQLGKIALHYR